MADAIVMRLEHRSRDSQEFRYEAIDDVESRKVQAIRHTVREVLSGRHGSNYQRVSELAIQLAEELESDLLQIREKGKQTPDNHTSTDVEVTAVAICGSARSDAMSKRFSIALSFPGEHRTFVFEIAKALADKLTRDRVFYDEWYEVELLGAGGDLKLQSMYTQADLVVPFFSTHYSKPWCSLEWETIRGILLNRRKVDAVIPVHLDDTEIPGWPAVNFGIRLRGRAPQQIADIIVQALAMRNPHAANAATTTSPSTVSQTAPQFQPASTRSSLTAIASSALAIWREKLDYLQQQEAIESNPATKFTIKKQIEEAERKIRELDLN